MEEADLDTGADPRAVVDTSASAVEDSLEEEVVVVAVVDIAVAVARLRLSHSSIPQLLFLISSQTRKHHSLASFQPQASADKPYKAIHHIIIKKFD